MIGIYADDGGKEFGKQMSTFSHQVNKQDARC